MQILDNDQRLFDMKLKSKQLTFWIWMLWGSQLDFVIILNSIGILPEVQKT